MYTVSVQQYLQWSILQMVRCVRSSDCQSQRKTSRIISLGTTLQLYLVSGLHCNYKKAKEHFNNHQNCHYQKLCAAMSDNFVQTDADKSRDVRNALNSSRQKAVKENRNSLSHIIRTNEFCGRQEISMRSRAETLVHFH